jgi:hypothetical protein
LKFDGRQYGPLPRVLALDQIASRLDGNDTLLVVNSPSGNLAVGMNTTGTLFGLLLDDAESLFSFSLGGNCQVRNSLSDSFPRVTPRFTTVIPQGRTGWMRLWSTQPRPLTGAAINFTAFSQTERANFNGGANLSPLRFTESSTMTMPVFPPQC